MVKYGKKFCAASSCVDSFNCYGVIEVVELVKDLFFVCFDELIDFLVNFNVNFCYVD